MAVLPNLPGTILRYNGVDFGSSTKTLSVSVTPIPDASGRTTAYNEYTFTFRTTVAGGPTSADAALVRRAVSKNGGVFIYTGRGLGDIAINTGIVRDVIWGPWVKNITFNTLAASNAFRVTWTIQVRIPECFGARYFGPFEIAYTASHEIDRYGYTTRTYSGHLRVPQNFVGNANRLLNDSPDDYREKLCPPLLHGYRRTFGPWVVSEDRTQLDFEFTDEEMGSNIPPEGIVDVKASHEAGAQLPFAKWTGTISAEYELAKPTAPAVAVNHFFGVLVKDRIQAAQRGAIRDAKGIAGVIPLSVNVAEPDIYGRIMRVRCALGYTYLWDFNSPTNPLAAGGLWRPVPQSNWTAWSTSLNATALHPRGNSRFVFKVNDEDIVDLCRPVPVPPPAYAPGKVVNRINAPIKNPNVDQYFPAPKQAESWLHYEASIVVEEDSGVVPVRTLPTQAEAKERLGQKGRRNGLTDFVRRGRRFDAGNLRSFATAESIAATAPLLGAAQGIAAGLNLGQRSDARLAAMVRARPLVYVYLRGNAARWGYPVPCPSLVEVNGMTPILSNRLDRDEGLLQTENAVASNTPIYFASWNLRYVLPDVPEGDYPIPPNPFFGA